MPDRPAECTAVSPECPVEATLYGYYPSLGWNAFFVGFFGLCCVINLVLGIRYRTWTYMVCRNVPQGTKILLLTLPRSHCLWALATTAAS
jgi:hypothetical protein